MPSKTVLWYPPGATFDDDPIVLHDATKLPYKVLLATQGLEMAPLQLTAGNTPGVGGGQLQSVTILPREAVVPVMMQAQTRAEMRALKRDLVAAVCHPERGAARVVFTDGIGTDSGEQRYFNAFYSRGLEGDGSNMGADWWRFTLTLAVLDPNYYSFEPVVATWTGRPGIPYFPRKFPYVLAPTGVIVGTPLELDGDTESWPSFTLAGPWSRVRFTRDATGESWEIARGQDYLTETLTMNTDPRLPLGPRTLDGQSRYSWLRFQSDLFPLSPGDTVSVEADGVTAETLLTLTVVPAWLTAP